MKENKKNRILIIRRVPSYNKYLSEPFRFREGDKVIVNKEEGFFITGVNIRLKKKITILKSYFRTDPRVTTKKQIEYD